MKRPRLFELSPDRRLILRQPYRHPLLAATESATVGCTVYDAYGNARDDIAATFWAQSLDGVAPLESGLWFDENTVSAAVG